MPPAVMIIGAVIGAAATVYSAQKAQQTADKAASENRKMTAAKNNADIELNSERASADRQRYASDAAKMDAANNNAMSQAESSEDRMRDENIRAREEQKRLSEQQGQVNYASKFKPGQGGDGDMSSSDFLVPKFDSNAGVQVDKSANSNPLGFAV